jgi:hypothetical protein
MLKLFSIRETFKIIGCSQQTNTTYPCCTERINEGIDYADCNGNCIELDTIAVFENNLQCEMPLLEFEGFKYDMNCSAWNYGGGYCGIDAPRIDIPQVSKANACER